jgi:hypothetical protein
MEFLIEVVDFDSKELRKIRNCSELTRRSDKALCVFEHPILCGLTLQM